MNNKQEHKQKTHNKIIDLILATALIILNINVLQHPNEKAVVVSNRERLKVEDSLK